MDDFISTETLMFLSLFGEKIPNLLECILRYSATVARKPVVLSRGSILTPYQIQEAKSHQNCLVSSALNAVANICGAIVDTGKKVDEFKEQRAVMEDIFKKLLAEEEKLREMED